MSPSESRERGGSLVEPLVAAVLLVTALAPVAGAYSRVALSRDARDRVRASLVAADIVDRARVGCEPVAAPSLRSTWTVRVTRTDRAGVAAVTAAVADANGRVLSSLSAPCLPR